MTKVSGSLMNCVIAFVSLKVICRAIQLSPASTNVTLATDLSRISSSSAPRMLI